MPGKCLILVIRGDIICDTVTWTEPIATRHPIMEGNLDAVKETIENPEAIYISSQTPVRNVYFARSTTATYTGLYTKVVVTVDDNNKTGSVVSAWPQKAMTGGITQGGIIYVKPRL